MCSKHIEHCLKNNKCSINVCQMDNVRSEIVGKMDLPLTELENIIMGAGWKWESELQLCIYY